MEMITFKPIQAFLCFLVWMSIITKGQGQSVVDAKQSGAKGDGVTDDSKVKFEQINHCYYRFEMFSF